LGVENATDKPEEILGNYDIVFARGRSALEAVATGCAVILCDALGFGEMLTTENYEFLRVRNFGRRTYYLSPTVETLMGQIRRYDPADAAQLAAHVRGKEGLHHATAALIDIFREVIEEFRGKPSSSCADDRQAAARFLERIAPTSNTFHFVELARPLEIRARNAEALVRRLPDTLFMSPLPREVLTQVVLREGRAPGRIAAGSKFLASVIVDNGTNVVLSNFGEAPMNCSYHWLHPGGETEVFNGERTLLYPPLPPGRSLMYAVNVSAPEQPGRYVLRLTIVQELVAWLDALGVFIDCECIVE
jgi:hypothetical protein